MQQQGRFRRVFGWTNASSLDIFPLKSVVLRHRVIPSVLLFSHGWGSRVSSVTNDPDGTIMSHGILGSFCKLQLGMGPSAVWPSQGLQNPANPRAPQCTQLPQPRKRSTIKDRLRQKKEGNTSR